MIRQNRHIALVSFNQFDPFLRDGGSANLLSLLEFLKGQGNQVSILNFLTNDLSYRFFDDALANGKSEDVVRKGNTCRAVFRGLDYYEEVFPFGLEQQSDKYQVILKVLMESIKEKNIVYVMTADEGYFPLLASWLLQIPGAQLFNSLYNVQMFERNTTYVRFLQKRTVFANSHFIQAQIKERLGVDSVLWYPFIDFHAYQSYRDGGRTNKIGFYSQGKIKGDAIVAEVIERMPERSFIVVGDRYGGRSDVSPGNLTYLGHIPDMKKFYGQIDLLLVPSLGEEAFGRVILEAAVNGIPAIANRIGGIPEALGDSGILIDIDLQEPNLDETVERYVEAICRLLNDEDVYQRYCQKALTWAKKYEIKQTESAHDIYNRYIKNP